MSKHRRNSVFVSNNKSSADGLKWAHMFNQTKLESIPEDKKSSAGSDGPKPRISKVSLNSGGIGLIASYSGDQIILPDFVDIKAIADTLNLTQASINELEKVESYNFNIFNLRESTKENELVTIVSHIMAKEKVFEKLPIEKQKFIPFMQQLQHTY